MRTRMVTHLLLAIALTAGACSDEPSAEPAGTTPGPSVTEASDALGPTGESVTEEGTEAELVVALIAGELTEEHAFAFGLEDEGLSLPGPEIRVPAGEPVSITLLNVQEFEGPYPHNFVVVTDKDQVPPAPLFGAISEGGLDPGERTTLTFTPDAQGSYFYICTVPGHAADGMWGNFIVE
ncbi:MAG TPA: sulfocyanin-like copper-binding protein [Actinomycetota bacterium]|nr:sulfocyanin-like copper-binding protein [Actinomycetota bacterium]